MPPCTLVPDWLSARARSHPGQTALVCGTQTLSFADLEQRAFVAAGRLARLGLRAGDRLAAVLGNGTGFVELMHGAMRLGVVLVPLGPRLTAAELKTRLASCDATLVCYDGESAPRVSGAGYRLCLGGDPLPGDPVWERILPVARDQDAPIDLDALHTVLYTSGSSGEPKGVCLTYGNHFSSAVGSAFNLGVHPQDRWLACLPFSHVGGLAILLRGVLYGTAVVVHERFDAERVNQAIDEDRVTIVSLVATMLDRVLDARGNRPYPPWLRCVLLGGGPAPRRLLEECAARRVPVVQTYGLTEAASQVTTLAPADALSKLGSAGRPLLTTEMRLADGEVPVEVDTLAEIQVRGPTVSPGYLGGAVQSRHAGGWLATGDLGRLDEEGFLYVTGRLDDRIICGGENVEPREVEAVLEAHPTVAEACVVGLPDPQWGEIIVACVRPAAGAEVVADELQAQARLSLAGFKVPRRVVVFDEFPRTASGKLLRRIVRDALGT